MQTSNPFYSLLYKRGFILADRPVDGPHPHWPVTELPGYWLCYDPLNSLIVVKHEDHWCALLGMVLDIFDPGLSPDHIVSTLIQKASVSFTAFLDYFDTLSGRFLLILGNDKEAKIFQDACGMRSVFYSTEHHITASHAQLLTSYLPNSCIDERFAGLLDRYTPFYLPGFFTPYKNVRALTPNTCLNITTLSIERFFPREPLEEQGPQEVFDYVDQLVFRQANYLSENSPLMVSITAGLDSRMTLSLLKDVRSQIQFFTYYKTNNNGLDTMKSPVLLRDKEVAQSIARNLELNHQVIEVNYDKQSAEEYRLFEQMMNRHTFMHHNHYLAKMYLDQLPPKRLHIRSNIHGVFRYYYRGIKSIRLPESISPYTMALCYSQEAAKEARIQEYFTEFFHTTQFQQMYNYPPYDMLYWEYRLGTWHANLLLESDISHETFCLFNNRTLLKTMLSLPSRFHEEDYVLHRLVDKHWPVLKYWPINDKRNDDSLFAFGMLNRNDGEVIAHSSKGEKTPVFFKQLNGHALFHLDINAPEKGDRLVFRKPIAVENGQGYKLSLVVQSPYEKRTLQGRIEYAVKLGGVEIIKEDIAAWDQPNLIQVVFTAADPQCVLEVEIRVLKDCEEKNWGRAAKIVVQSVHLKKVNYRDKIKANASSPFSQLSVAILKDKLLRKLEL